MARQPRLHFKGAVYHVVLKSLDGKSIFKSKVDRQSWEELVEEGCSRFGHQIHAYIWLKNQINLIIQVNDIALSRIMQNLSFRYTRYFNQKYNSEGPIFHGRYKATLVDPDEHLIDLTHCVHNLALTESGVRSLEAFPWSSYQDYVGASTKPWVTTTRVLSAFDKSPKRAITAFKKYSATPSKDTPCIDLVLGNRGGRVLGGKKFQQKVLKPPKRKQINVTLPKLVRYICQAEGISESALKNASRARYESELRQLISYVAIELDVATLADMARRFNRDITTMSRNQRFFRDKLQQNSELRKTANRYKKAIQGL